MLTSLAALMAAAAAPTQCPCDDKQFYGDIGYAFVTFDTEDDLGFDTESDSLISHVGWDATKYLGAEAEIGIVSFPREGSNDIISAEVKTTVTLGAYGVARYPVTKQLSVYGRAGYVYADAETTVEFMGVETMTEDTYQGLGLGAGLRYRLGDTANSLRSGYTRYDLNKIDAGAWSVEFMRHF